MSADTPEPATDSPPPSPSDAASGGFIWPPRPVHDPHPVGTEACAGREPASVPRAASRDPADIHPPVQARARLGIMSMIVEHVEDAWLGLAVPPVDRRIRETGWAPDLDDRYCPRCATTVGEHEVLADAGACSWCRSRRLAWDRAVRLGEYDGLLRDLVQEIKFSGARRTGRRLGELLGQRLALALRRSGIEPASGVIVPVPSSWRRLVARGIDHAALIAGAVSEASGCGFERLLVRKHRRSQTTLPPGRRRANVRGAFLPRPGASLRSRVVVLVDDIRTTGATVSACAAAVCALARTQAGRDVDQARPERDGNAQLQIWCCVAAVTPLRDAALSGRPRTPSTSREAGRGPG